MLAYTHEILAKAEAAAKANDIDAVFQHLRALCLDDFGELLLNMPDPDFPGLSGILPPMASAEVQSSWTGSSGYTLLRQTLNFTKSVNYNFNALIGRPLNGAKMLDFGCGYGRIARLMYYYTSPENLHCVDPWDESLRICKENRLLGNFYLSDYVPTSLPFDEHDFDLIYCFSVFTHLSMKTVKSALGTLRNYISKNGLLVITIRPEEYWLTSAWQEDPDPTHTAEQLIAEHRREGFAFVPHNRAPIDGDITYGDTSMTFDWLTREFPQWKIAGHDRTQDDPYQIVVFLTPI